MPKTKEKIFLFVIDFLTINIAFWITYWIRFKSGWLSISPFYPVLEPVEMLLPMFVLYIVWFLLFVFFGLYKSWYLSSRLDEFIVGIKAISIGCFFLFVVTVNPADPIRSSRMIILTYFLLMLFAVGFGRVLVHTFHRKLLEKGIGLRPSLIIGWGSRALSLFDKVELFPALGYKIVGFVFPREVGDPKGEYKGIKVLGRIRDLPSLIKNYEIKEILIAIQTPDDDRLIDVIENCNGRSVSLKIVPDLHEIIYGEARTNQIYGFPLIEIMPNFMPDWERNTKRMFDITISLVVLILFLPLWIIIALLIISDSKGPILYKQDRVGKNGKIFSINKYRSMIQDAEKESGPVWAKRNDHRITRVGKWLRILRMDEIPQFINVLKGNMSLVGPRPERPFFVEKLKIEIPLYTKRLNVRPGITGWAQVKHKYDTSLDDVKIKLKYDLFYLENMSLRLDLKILLNTLYVIITGKGN